MFQHNVVLYEHASINDSHLPCFILTPEGEIQHLNATALKLFGSYYVKGQFLDMDEPSYKKWLLLINNIQNTTSPIISDFNIILKNGFLHQVTIKASWCDKHSCIHVFLLSYEEIKEKPSIAENLYQMKANVKMSYRQLMQYVSKGIVITSSHGKIIDINNCALVLLNKKRLDVIYEMHHTLFEHLYSEDASYTQYLEGIRLHDHACCTMVYETKNHKRIYLKFESVKDQSGNFVITTISDVTKKVLMKNQLEQNYTLHAIGQMAASIAHEIRNPMTSLLGFTALLKEQASDEAANYLSVIESELHRIENILGEMLLLSKPKPREFKTIDVFTIMQDVVNIMVPHASMYNCTLQFIDMANFPCLIDGCEGSIKQVLMNLLKNAMEAMLNGGVITIELRYRTDDFFEINIIDQGMGIEEKHLNKLFEPFQTTKLNGTGLGLPFVKEVMYEHHGKVEVTSQIGVGSTFKLLFPKAKNAKIAIVMN